MNGGRYTRKFRIRSSGSKVTRAGRLRGVARLTRLKGSRGTACSRLLLAALLGLALLVPPALAHDIPDEIRLHGFVKPEGNRLHFLVRVPLTMLQNLNLPRRGPGHLDLTQIDDGLRAAAVATAKDLALFENRAELPLLRATTRIAQPSDRSFESYEQALAHLHGRPLPPETDVFWNQGYFDAHLEYIIGSETSDFALDMRLAPGLRGRLKLIVRFLPPGGGVRAYEVHGGYGHVALDPRWHQAAWVFVQSGFFHILDGIDHLLFLFALLIPFRRLNWKLLAVITSFTVAHSITLIAAAMGLVPAGAWFPPLVEAGIALSIVYMAVENVVAPNLRRRWLITGAFGLVHGFGFSFALQQDLQFAGSHLLLSLLAFNVGIEGGQVLVLLLTLPALALLFRHRLAERVGSIILSVLVAHTGWHWMLERSAALRRVQWPTLDAAAAVTLARGALVVLLAGGAVWFLARQVGRRLAPEKPSAGEDLA